MILQLYTIARNTFIESVRQPIYTVLILAGVIGLALLTASSKYTLDDDNRLLIDQGVALLAIIGFTLSAFTAGGVISEEIENKTVLTVISKPIARPTFVLGKFLGISAAMLIALWILTIGFLLCLRHGVMQTAADKYDGPVLVFGLLALLVPLCGAALLNYLYRWVFTSTFVGLLLPCATVAMLAVLMLGKGFVAQGIGTEFGAASVYQGGQLLIVILLIYEAILLVTAVAVCASTRLGWVMTIVICIAVPLLGALNEKVLYESIAVTEPFGEQVGLGAQAMWVLQSIPSWLPNFEFLWVTDALHQKHTIPMSHVGWLTLYCALYVFGILCLAVNLFQTREVS